VHENRKYACHALEERLDESRDKERERERKRETERESKVSLETAGCTPLGN